MEAGLLGPFGSQLHISWSVFISPNRTGQLLRMLHLHMISSLMLILFMSFLTISMFSLALQLALFQHGLCMFSLLCRLSRRLLVRSRCPGWCPCGCIEIPWWPAVAWMWQLPWLAIPHSYTVVLPRCQGVCGQLLSGGSTCWSLITSWNEVCRKELERIILQNLPSYGVVLTNSTN